MPKSTPDAMLGVLGFTVTIDGGGTGGDVDSAWETATGGSLHTEVPDPAAPGFNSVDPVVLQGPLTAQVAAGRSGRPGPPSFLENGAGRFKIDIQDAPVASGNVESITVEDLLIDERELTTGLDWDYRVFEPGDAHYGSITIRSRLGKESNELYQWWLDTSRGKNIRKSISVALLKRDGSAARTYNFFECLPHSYEPFFQGDPRSPAVEGVVARCEAVELVCSDGRKALCSWINDTVNGKPWKRTLTINEITRDDSAGRTFNYLDAFPTRYVFPSLSVAGTGNLSETITVKPIRVELR